MKRAGACTRPALGAHVLRGSHRVHAAYPKKMGRIRFEGTLKRSLKHRKCWRCRGPLASYSRIYQNRRQRVNPGDSASVFSEFRQGRDRPLDRSISAAIAGSQPRPCQTVNSWAQIPKTPKQAPSPHPIVTLLQPDYHADCAFEPRPAGSACPHRTRSPPQARRHRRGTLRTPRSYLA